MYIKGFKAFSQKIYEQVEGSDDGLFIVYDDNVDGGSKELAMEFLENLKSAEGGEISGGESGLQAWQSAWEARRSLDQGQLRKEGGWYFGKGAWRINSNKAVKLGMQPKWMQWEDPLHDEIIENFFPELMKGGDQSDMAASSADIQSDELSDIDLPDWVYGEEETELASMGESKSHKMKHLRRIIEQDEFTLGPPSSTEGEANVYTPEMLMRKLVRNYNMGTRKNVMIWGAPGIGKTQIVKQAAKEIAKQKNMSSLPVMIVTLAQMMPTDLGGVPLLYDASAEGKGTEKMVLPADMEGKVKQGYTIPAWLPGLQDADEGILFFDEVNRADQDMLAASLTLLLDREAAGGKYNMPAGWRIWAAGNREMDGPVKPLEAAVASRFLGGHVHLVPTIEAWIEWARSDKGFFAPEGGSVVDEWYIPDEFIAYLKHAESGKGSMKYFDLKGKEVKTDFKQFYRYDKAKLSAGGEGVAVGFPTPRNWAAAWSTIYDQFMKQDKYQDQLTGDQAPTDPREQGIAALALILQDPDDSQDMEMELGDVVGQSAAKDFMSYVKILRRHSDKDGTINEKVDNVFSNPSKPRPLVSIPPVNTSERDKILSLVLSKVENKGEDLTAKEYLNWTKYCVDLVQGGKADSGELGAHVKSVNTSTPKAKEIAKKVFSASLMFKKTGDAKLRELALAIKPFEELFREILHDFNI